MVPITYIFAVCESPSGSERFWGIVLPLLGAAIFVGILIGAIRGSRRPKSLIMLFFSAVVIGYIIISTPGGLSSSDGDYFARSLTALTAGLILGGIWAALAKLNVLRAIITGGLGGVAPTVWFIGLLIFGLSVANTCLG